MVSPFLAQLILETYTVNTQILPLLGMTPFRTNWPRGCTMKPYSGQPLGTHALHRRSHNSDVPRTQLNSDEDNVTRCFFRSYWGYYTEIIPDYCIWSKYIDSTEMFGCLVSDFRRTCLWAIPCCWSQRKRLVERSCFPSRLITPIRPSTTC